MQIHYFTISAFDDGKEREELNKFLRGHKVIEVQQEFVSTENGAHWCVGVRYVSGAKVAFSKEKKVKVDYREVLNEKTFKIFDDLRDCRKVISDTEGIPVYTVFHNAELAKVAALKEMSVEQMKKITGIGSNKMEKYGKRLIEMYQSKVKNETSR